MERFGDWRLVLWHRYAERGGHDLSGAGNHGYRVLAERATGDDWSRFRTGADRILVAPSQELHASGGHLVHVSGRIGQLGERNVIVEGYLAYSLFVEADGTLSAGIFLCGRWLGVASRPGLVRAGQPFDITLLCSDDGLVQLVHDGTLLVRRRHSLGAPRGVSWPYGLSVGAWPDAGLRVFDGVIDELAWWRTAGDPPPRGPFRAIDIVEPDPGSGRVLTY
jgi:hypothetical protein